MKQTHTLGTCHGLENFTVWKQIHTLGTCHGLENFTVLKQTHTFEHISHFGTFSAFVTCLRFKSIVLANFLSIFRKYTRYKKYTRNSNK